MEFTYDLYCYVMPFIAGIIVSLLYHIGLWWTVKALPSSQRPALLSIGSFYIRMGITLSVFYLVMNNSWQRLVVCLLGFLVVKFTMTHMLKAEENTSRFR